MKKMRYILLLICLFIFPLNINAAEANVSLECDKEYVNQGDSVNCTLKLNVLNGKVSLVQGEFLIGNNLKLKTIDYNSQLFEGKYTEGATRIIAYTSSTSAVPEGNNIEVATLVLEVSSTTNFGTTLNVAINNIKLGDENNNKIQNSNTTLNKEFKVASNFLTSLSVSSGSLSPAFSKNVTNYSVSTKSDKITINATVEDSNATVEGNGTKNLNIGSNTFTITVKNGSMANRVYTIRVNREQSEDTRDKDNTLSSLKINNDEIKLESNKTNYSYEVGYDITSISILAELNSSKAQFLNNSGKQNIELDEGENTVEIVVQAENGSSKTYVITINRKSKPVVEPDDKIEEDSGNNNTNDKKDENIDKGPQTGNSIIYLFILLIIVSIPVTIIAYKKYSKSKEA